MEEDIGDLDRLFHIANSIRQICYYTPALTAIQFSSAHGHRGAGSRHLLWRARPPGQTGPLQDHQVRAGVHGHDQDQPPGHPHHHRQGGPHHPGD